MGPIPYVFGKAKERLISELHEMITVAPAVAFALDLNLLCCWSPPGRVFKRMENDHFLIFLAVCVIFPKFLRRFRSALC